MDARQGAAGQRDLGLGTRRPPGQARSSLLLAQPVPLLWTTVGKQGKENNDG